MGDANPANARYAVRSRPVAAAGSQALFARMQGSEGDIAMQNALMALS